MLNETEVRTQTKQAIVKAIGTLKARGSAVNVYSVSVESGIPRTSLIGDAELMSLLNSPSALDGDLDAETKRLRNELEESQAEMSRLNAQINALKLQAQKNAKSTQIAWQQGYLAGQEAAFEEEHTPKSLVESLAEAAETATAYGDDHGDASKAEREADTIQQPALSRAELQESQSPAESLATYVAEVPLQISDPEVLNDPFTAKLLQALQTDPEDAEPSMAHIEPKYEDVTVSQIEIPADQLLENKRATTEYVKLVDGPVDEHGEQLHKKAPPLPGADEEHYARPLKEPVPDLEISTNFTADELHSLFRNRYVKGEEVPEPVKPPEPAPAAATATGVHTTKKFVGAKAASTESLPAGPRVFPPEIRKACKLLGLNPEELSKVTVLESWKREMAKPGVHPDTGGDTEMAIYLNTAKDTLMRWVESQTPKLGKKFGQQSKVENPKHQPKQD